MGTFKRTAAQRLKQCVKVRSTPFDGTHITQITQCSALTAVYSMYRTEQKDPLS